MGYFMSNEKFRGIWHGQLCYFKKVTPILMKLSRQLVARQDITAVDTREEETTTEKSTMEDRAEDLESG